MIIKIKAFIYRFSNVFGLHIYLAQKEEDQYIKSLPKQDRISRGCSIGLWQAQHGFTTVWTSRLKFGKRIVSKLKHAFQVRG
jgi:hypothetical protein